VYTPLNLSSRPFRNRTLPWAVTAVVMGITLVTLLIILHQARQTSLQADAVEVEAAKERQQFATLQANSQRVLESLSPEDLRALQAAHLLVDRKRFSWSRLFTDLEAGVPANVRVESIDVRDVLRNNGRTFADLQMKVVGRQTSDVLEMINTMNRGGLFDAVATEEKLLEDQNETGIEFTLRVRYVPPAVIVTSRETAAAIGGPNEGAAAVGQEGARQ
jgi:Tfp pilus assembly protein PilN